MTRISIGDIITFVSGNEDERYFVHRYLRSHGTVVLRSCANNTLGTISLHSLQLQLACETAFASSGGLSAEEASALQREAKFNGKERSEGEILRLRNERRVRLEEKYGTLYASRRLQSERAKARVREKAERLKYWVDLFDGGKGSTELQPDNNGSYPGLPGTEKIGGEP